MSQLTHDAQDIPARRGRRAKGTATLRASTPRRWPAALGVIAALLIFGDGETPPLGPFAAVLAFMPIAYLLFGWARRELSDARQLAIQLAGLVAYSELAVAAVVLGGSAGRYVLAAGWLGHAAWDLYHHRTDRVVPRPWAEWCFVLDVIGAVAIVAL